MMSAFACEGVELAPVMKSSLIDHPNEISEVLNCGVAVDGMVNWMWIFEAENDEMAIWEKMRRVNEVTSGLDLRDTRASIFSVVSRLAVI